MVSPWSSFVVLLSRIHGRLFDGWCLFWAGLDHRLGADVTKSHNVEKELGELKVTLLMESDEHDALRVTVQLICDHYEMTPA